MPTFIDMSNLAKRSTLTGNEEFQVSATEKVTSQQIADLAPAKEVKRVVVTDFQTNEWTLIGGVSVSFPNDIKEGEIVTFTNSKNATNGPGVELFGYAIKCTSRMASYVGMTLDYKLNSIPTIYMYKSAGAYSTAWQQLPDESVKTVEITDGTQTRLGGAIQVTAFTRDALSSLVYDYKPGDFIPFYTGNVTASADNQFPESGIFNGFISMGSNKGDYFQIFAFKSGSTKAYLGACIGSTTQWTALGGGGAQTVIRLPGMDVELNPSDGAIIPYTSIELTKLSPGVTLMLCFEIADADGRFSPSGNVVVYFDLPPANNLWNAIAGFFDSATSFNGSINVRRRVAGVLDFQCTSALLDGYPGLQVYLRHIFVLR